MPNHQISLGNKLYYLSAGAAHAFQDGQALLTLTLDCCQLVLLHIAHFIEQAFLAFVQDLPQLRHPLLGHAFVCVRVSEVWGPNRLQPLGEGAGGRGAP